MGVIGALMLYLRTSEVGGYFALYLIDDRWKTNVGSK